MCFSSDATLKSMISSSIQIEREHPGLSGFKADLKSVLTVIYFVTFHHSNATQIFIELFSFAIVTVRIESEYSHSSVRIQSEYSQNTVRVQS